MSENTTIVSYSVDGGDEIYVDPDPAFEIPPQIIGSTVRTTLVTTASIVLENGDEPQKPVYIKNLSNVSVDQGEPVPDVDLRLHFTSSDPIVFSVSGSTQATLVDDHWLRYDTSEPVSITSVRVTATNAAGSTNRSHNFTVAASSADDYVLDYSPDFDGTVTQDHSLQGSVTFTVVGGTWAGESATYTRFEIDSGKPLVLAAPGPLSGNWVVDRAGLWMCVNEMIVQQVWLVDNIQRATGLVYDIGPESDFRRVDYVERASANNWPDVETQVLSAQAGYTKPQGVYCVDNTRLTMPYPDRVGDFFILFTMEDINYQLASGTPELVNYMAGILKITTSDQLTYGCINTEGNEATAISVVRLKASAGIVPGPTHMMVSRQGTRLQMFAWSGGIIDSNFSRVYADEGDIVSGFSGGVELAIGMVEDKWKEGVDEAVTFSKVACWLSPTSVPDISVQAERALFFDQVTGELLDPRIAEATHGNATFVTPDTVEDWNAGVNLATGSSTPFVIAGLDAGGFGGR